MRLIDADELAGKLKRLKERIDKISINREAQCLVDVTQVIEYVENAPTVEANLERTCASCANNKFCIMAGDGNWKACKDYQPTGNGNDLIRRADAIEAVMAEGRKVYTSEYASAERIIYEADAVEVLSMLPSAEASQNLARPNKELIGSDLISRADAIEFINSGISLDTYADMEYATEMLKNIPQAEAVQGGTWRDGFGFAHCSICGRGVPRAIGKQTPFNFCPYCGARMRNEK